MLTIFLWSNAWFSCIDGVAGIMPIITCPSCNLTNTPFCCEMGFVENTRFCHKTGFVANTRLFGFVWCRLLRRHLGFGSVAQISGLKIGGWQHWSWPEYSGLWWPTTRRLPAPQQPHRPTNAWIWPPQGSSQQFQEQVGKYPGLRKAVDKSIFNFVHAQISKSQWWSMGSRGQSRSFQGQQLQERREVTSVTNRYSLHASSNHFPSTNWKLLDNWIPDLLNSS